METSVSARRESSRRYLHHRFEGQPHRTTFFAERPAQGARGTAIVASLIRSIDYSATASAGAHPQAGARRAGQARHRTGGIGAIARLPRSCAYANSCQINACGRPICSPPSDAEFLPDEKALCEIEYELIIDPIGLRVPLTGLLSLLSQRPNEAS